MKIIDLTAIRNLFLILLDNAKHTLEQSGDNEVALLDYRSKTFLEYGYYNEAIAEVPEGEKEFPIPNIFVVDDGAILNNPIYESYAQDVAFEFLAFEHQRPAFRRLLEMFASELRGKEATVILDTDTSRFFYKDNDTIYSLDDNPSTTYGTNIVNYKIAIDTELPVLNETLEQSGYDRFEAYINLSTTVNIGAIFTSDIPFTIDGEAIPLTEYTISGTKSEKVYNVKGNTEITSYAERKTLSLEISGTLKSGSNVCTKIRTDIKKASYLNEPYEIKYDGETYKMFLTQGTLTHRVLDTVGFSASFSMLKEIV